MIVLRQEITIEKTMNKKCSCCAELLHIENAKYMKVGLKDKISEYADFAYVYGNEATLGFQQSGLKSSFPITLIPRNIDEFTSKKYKIIFILQKKIREEKYRELLVEIKKVSLWSIIKNCRKTKKR